MGHVTCSRDIKQVSASSTLINYNHDNHDNHDSSNSSSSSSSINNTRDVHSDDAHDDDHGR